VRAHRVDDALRQRAAVEGLGAAGGERAQRRGQLRVAQQEAGGLGAAVGLQEQRRRRSASRRGSPGVPTDRPPSAASRKRSGRPSVSRNWSAVAAAGAVSRPSQASSLPPARS